MFIREITEKKYDIIIVGTGPAGISLALRLAKKPKLNILLIETGTLEIKPEISKLSEIEATGDLASSYYPRHAQRVFGGTSKVWAGYCATMEERSFLNKEWPINYDELNSYYKDAANILELPDEAYQAPVKKISQESNIEYKPYYLSPPVRFNEKYRSVMRGHQSIDVLLKKTCTKVLSNGDFIEGLLIQDSEASSTTTKQVKASHYVLACGGLGNPRLLKLSKIASESPVGQYFTEHPHIYNCGKLELSRDVIKPLLSGGKVVHALQLSDKFCIKNNLLNFTVSFLTDKTEDRAFLGEKKSVYFSNVIIRSEMASQATNAISFTDQLDQLKQPKTGIHFDFSYQELARTTWDAFARELLVSGIGRATTSPSNSYDITGGGHYMGTTRMGTTAQNSVVDKNCKLHSFDNLYIAGSSVFSAPGAANPTFSIVALSLRLADHLSTKIGEEKSNES